jgi:neutral ceramidase
VAIVLLSTLAATALAQDSPNDMMGGAASVDITPPTGFPMWGYGDRHDMPSVGVMDALHARALVLQAGDDKVALVGLDLGRSPTRSSMATIRAAVQERAGVSAVMIVGSHTHHGPVIETESWPTPNAPYARTLEQRIADVVVEAASTVTPALVALDQRDIQLNRNRHWKGDNPPLDQGLSTLHLTAPDGRAIATLVNYAAHATMHDSERLEFSGDYPGHMARLVEEATGGVCVFMQGAAGDLSALPAGGRSAEGMGAQLATEVLAALAEMQPAPVADARIASREDDFHFASRVDFASPLVMALYSEAFYPEIVEAAAAEFADGVRPHLTTVYLAGAGLELAFAGVSGELFCDLGLRLKARAPSPTMVFGYCNGHQLYFPTIEGAAMGGYGGDSTVAPIEVGGPEAMIDRALIRILEMRGDL